MQKIIEKRQDQSCTYHLKKTSPKVVRAFHTRKDMLTFSSPANSMSAEYTHAVANAIADA